VTPFSLVYLLSQRLCLEAMVSKRKKRSKQNVKKHATTDLINTSTLSGKTKLVESIIKHNHFLGALDKCFNVPTLFSSLWVQNLHDANVLQDWRQHWCRLIIQLYEILNCVDKFTYSPSNLTQLKVLNFHLYNERRKIEFLKEYKIRAQEELTQNKTEHAIFKKVFLRAEVHKPEALNSIKWLMDAKYIETRLCECVLSHEQVSFLVWSFAYIEMHTNPNEVLEKESGARLKISADLDYIKDTYYMLCNIGWFKSSPC